MTPPSAWLARSRSERPDHKSPSPDVIGEAFTGPDDEATGLDSDCTSERGDP